MDACGARAEGTHKLGDGGLGPPGLGGGTCLLARVQREAARSSRRFRLKVQPGRLGARTSRSTGPLLLGATMSQVQRAALSETWAWATISSQEVARSRLEPCRGWGRGCPGRGCGWRGSASCGLHGGSGNGGRGGSQDWGPGAGVSLRSRNNGGCGQESSALYPGEASSHIAPLPLLGAPAGQGRLGGPPHPQQREVSPLRGRGRAPAWARGSHKAGDLESKTGQGRASPAWRDTLN